MSGRSNDAVIQRFDVYLFVMLAQIHTIAIIIGLVLGHPICCPAPMSPSL